MTSNPEQPLERGRKRMIIPIISILLALAVILISGTSYAKKNAAELFVKSTRRALARSGMKRKSLTAGDAAIVYWEGGSGARTLLLIHGVNDQAGTWSPVVPHLLEKYHVVLIDLPGHGESAPATGPITMQAMQAALDAVVSATSPQRPVTLIGNSMGGWVSMLYAADHPQRVERLVLEDASGMMWDLSKVPLFPKSREEAAALMKLVWGPKAPAAPDMVLDDLVKRVPTMPQTRTIQGGIIGHLVDARLAELKMPVTLIWGADDGLLPLAYAEALKGKIAGSQLLVIENSAHISHRQKTPEFLETLDIALGS